MFGGNNEDPFKDLENFFRRMSVLGSQFGSSSSSSSSHHAGNLHGGNFTSSFSSRTSDGNFESNARGSFCPNTTVCDAGKQYLVDVDVPGISREDLKVTATNTKLCVSGQRRAVIHTADNNNGNNNGNDNNQKQKQKFPVSSSSFQQPQQQQGSTASDAPGFNSSVLLDERPTGFFERCFTFSHKIDEGGISAEVNNGVLSLAVNHFGPTDGSKDIKIK